MKNPYMEALTAGGSLASKTSSVASNFMSNSINAFNTAGSLAVKMLTLLEQEEARKNQELIQTTKLMQDAYFDTLSQEIAEKQLKISESSLDVEKKALDIKERKLKLEEQKFENENKGQIKLFNGYTQGYTINDFGIPTIEDKKTTFAIIDGNIIPLSLLFQNNYSYLGKNINSYPGVNSLANINSYPGIRKPNKQTNAVKLLTGKDGISTIAYGNIPLFFKNPGGNYKSFGANLDRVFNSIQDSRTRGEMAIRILEPMIKNLNIDYSDGKNQVMKILNHVNKISSYLDKKEADAIKGTAFVKLAETLDNVSMPMEERNKIVGTILSRSNIDSPEVERRIIKAFGSSYLSEDLLNDKSFLYGMFAYATKSGALTLSLKYLLSPFVDLYKLGQIGGEEKILPGVSEGLRRTIYLLQVNDGYDPYTIDETLRGTNFKNRFVVLGRNLASTVGTWDWEKDRVSDILEEKGFENIAGEDIRSVINSVKEIAKNPLYEETYKVWLPKKKTNVMLTKDDVKDIFLDTVILETFWSQVNDKGIAKSIEQGLKKWIKK